MDLTSTVPNVTLCSHWPQHAMTKQPEVMHFQRQIAIRVARGEATICDSEWEGQSKQCKTLEWRYASRKWKILATTKGSERLGYICPTVISVFLIPDTGSQSQLPNQPMTFTLLSLKCMTCLNRILSVFMLQMLSMLLRGLVDVFKNKSRVPLIHDHFRFNFICIALLTIDILTKQLYINPDAALDPSRQSKPEVAVARKNSPRRHE